jgi:hypothetical protein
MRTVINILHCVNIIAVAATGFYADRWIAFAAAASMGCVMFLENKYPDNPPPPKP